MGATSVGLARAESVRPTCLDRAQRDWMIGFVLPDRFANGDVTNDRGGLNRAAHGSCASAVAAPGSCYRVEIGPLEDMICVSEVGQ